MFTFILNRRVLAIICLTVVASQGFGKSNVSVDVLVSIGVHAEFHGTNYPKNIFGKCSGGEDEVYDIRPQDLWSSSGNGTFSENHFSAYQLSHEYGAGGMSFSYVPRTTSVITTLTQENGRYVTKIKLNDAHNFHQNDSSNGECNDAHFRARVAKDIFKGTIRINYHVPANTWAVDLRVPKKEGVFLLTESESISGNLSPVPNELSTSILRVWTRPGSKLSITYKFSDTDTSKTAIGELEVDFIPIKSKFKPAEAIKHFSSLLQKNNLTSAEQNQATNLILPLLNNPNDLQAALKTLPHKFLIEFYRKLDLIVRMPENGAIGWNFKAAVTIFTHELLANELRHIAPYCSKNSTRTVLVSGEKETLFLYSQKLILDSLSTIKNYPHANLKEFENLLAFSQHKGLTYKLVMEDQHLRDQFLDAYTKLSQKLPSRHDSIQYISEILNYSQKLTHSTSLLPARAQEVLNHLQESSVKEKLFLELFNNILLNFKTRSQTLIEVQEFSKQLLELESNHKLIAKNLQEESILFLGADYGYQTSGMASSLKELANLFLLPLTSDKNEDSQYFALSAAYFDLKTSQELASQLKGCL